MTIPCCPFCGEDRLIEADPVTGRYVCLVCAKTWPMAVLPQNTAPATAQDGSGTANRRPG